jgi:hypothetical protein
MSNLGDYSSRIFLGPSNPINVIRKIQEVQTDLARADANIPSGQDISQSIGQVWAGNYVSKIRLGQWPDISGLGPNGMAITGFDDIYSDVATEIGLYTGDAVPVRIGAINASPSGGIWIDNFQPLVTGAHTITTADLTAAANARYLLDISGMTAARNFIIPAGTLGAEIEIIVYAGCDTYELILKGATGVAIDGGSAATEWSRLFITGERVRLVCSGVNYWRVSNDGRIPSLGLLERITTDLTTNTAGAQTTPAWNSAVINQGAICDLTNYRMKCRRAGVYICSGAYSPLVGISDQNYARLYFLKNATNIAHAGNRASCPAGGTSLVNTSIPAFPVSCAAGDTLTYQYCTQEANRGLIKDETAGFEGSNYFTVREALPSN